MGLIYTDTGINNKENQNKDTSILRATIYQPYNLQTNNNEESIIPMDGLGTSLIAGASV
jgi:hypothetical protein